MKPINLLIYAIIALATVATSACSKEKFARPVITEFKLGYDNSGTVIAGEELHIEAELEAEAKIDRVVLEIHFEGEHGKKSYSYRMQAGEWEVDTAYSKFNGLKNTSFHEHIDVAADAEPGHYHVHFSVIDKEGGKAEVEAELEVKPKGF